MTPSGGIGGKGIVVTADTNTTVNGYQVPALSAEQIQEIYNAVVAGKSVSVVDATEKMYFQGVDADVISNEVFVSFRYFNVMLLEYAEDGSINFTEIDSTGAVKFNEQQNLSDAEKLQARSNIGASGIFPQVTVYTLVNATVKIKEGTFEKEYSSGDRGVVTIDIPYLGNWEVSSTDGQETVTKDLVVDAVKLYSIELPLGFVYGVEWSRTSSSAWARTDAAENFADPVPFVNNGMTGDQCSSPFDDIYPWAGMVRVTDPNAGELVAIPKFYYKWTVDAAKMKLQISSKHQYGFHVSPAHMDRGDGKGERDVVYVGRYHCSSSNYKSESGVRPKASITRATARSNIHNLGNDIWQLDHAMWWTIDMLYLVEFADANCQGTIGYGRGNGSSTENMGYTDTMPYHTGTMAANKTTYGVTTQYRNIEGLWDNVVDWCDGIYFSRANVYHIINPANFSDTTGGTLTGTRATASGRVITGFTFPSIEGFEWAGYPSDADIGSSGTTGSDYFCDNEYYSDGGVVLCVGGYCDQLQVDGLFYRYGTYSASHTGASIGARLQKLP